MLRRLRGPHGLSDEEAQWRRGQAWRRLFGSALMLVLAGLLAWAVLVVGERAQNLPDTPEAHHFLQLYTIVWIVFLLLLLALVILASVDIWFTRRFSLRQQRKILADRRAMLEREVARLRERRNGDGEQV
jgi:heme/copper-type cytochrome/quinol oxidase subunit 2